MTTAQSKNWQMLLPKVSAALIKAHEAAGIAAAEFARNCSANDHGPIRDTCGEANLFVRKPGYALREALKHLGQIDKWSSGDWCMGNFYQDVPDVGRQSITAHELACKKACEVLRRHFPDAEFFVRSHVD